MKAMAVIPTKKQRQFGLRISKKGQALRLRSGQALRLRSGQALRLRSGQALRLGSAMLTTRRSGQASLEITLSLTCVLILLFGSLNIFLWLNKQMLERQEYYEHSENDIRNETSSKTYGSGYNFGRVEAADGENDGQNLVVDETRFREPLDVFAKIDSNEEAQ